MTDSLKDAHEAIAHLMGTLTSDRMPEWSAAFEAAHAALDKAVEKAQEAAEKRMREFLDKRLAAERERVLREVESRGRDGFTVEQGVHAVRNDMGLLQSQPATGGVNPIGAALEMEDYADVSPAPKQRQKDHPYHRAPGGVVDLCSHCGGSREMHKARP